ncbi:MAG: hypothetical protein ABR552_04280 [Actinomycetota bacterium]
MRRALITTVLAIGLVAGFRVFGAGSETPPSKPVPPLSEGSASEPERPQGTVPVIAQRAGISCANGWSPFDDPVAHYTLCVPPGWGFSELTSPGPLTQVRSVTLENLHLLGPDAFPWHTGDDIYAAVIARNIVEVELDVVPASVSNDPANPGPCIPAVASAMTSCEERYDASGETADPNGPLHVLKVAVPLMRAPSPVNAADTLEGAARLQITIRSRADRYTQEVDLLWSLVRSVTPY